MNFGNKQTNKLNDFNKVSKNQEVQAITELFNTYNVKYKKQDLKHYQELYNIDITRFINTCKICSNRSMYSPLSYFIKVFNNPQSTTQVKNNYKTFYNNSKNTFCNFPQRKYNYNELEKILLANNKIENAPETQKEIEVIENVLIKNNQGVYEFKEVKTTLNKLNWKEL